MKKIILLSFLFPISIFSFSQTNSPNVVAAGGEYFIAGTFSNSYTIGEMAMVETYTTTGFILTQGFQQPYEFPLAVVANESFQGFSAFPNPSSGMVALQYNLASACKVNVTVFDAFGQLVYMHTEEKIQGAHVDNLNFADFSNGLYTIRYSIETPNGNSSVFSSRIILNK